jgi:Flp pilus assembly protein TadD
MSPLTPPDSHHLLAAQGWLGLGAHQDAAAELDCLAPTLRAHPDVLAVRWQVCAVARNWEDAVACGAALAEIAPDDPRGWLNRSYALHELRRTAEALDSLLGVVTRFPAEPTMRYNLACYACQLGDLPAARAWLERAFAGEGGGALRSAASDDPDLAPLWAEAHPGQS